MSDVRALLLTDVVDSTRQSAALADEAAAAIGPVVLRENSAADVALGAKPLEVKGLAKPVVARILSLAEGGRTLLSGAAVAALGGAIPAGQVLRRHGFYRVKGVDEPEEIAELAAPSATCAPPPDVEKACRVVRTGDPWSPTRRRCWTWSTRSSPRACCAPGCRHRRGASTSPSRSSGCTYASTSTRARSCTRPANRPKPRRGTAATSPGSAATPRSTGCSRTAGLHAGRLLRWSSTTWSARAGGLSPEAARALFTGVLALCQDILKKEQE